MDIDDFEQQLQQLLDTSRAGMATELQITKAVLSLFANVARARADLVSAFGHLIQQHAPGAMPSDGSFEFPDHIHGTKQ
jgi:hypothetical protein